MAPSGGRPLTRTRRNICPPIICGTAPDKKSRSAHPPGIYDVTVDTASEHVRLTVDQATAKTTMDLGKDVEKHGIKAVANTDAVLWLKHNAEGYLTECLQGGNPDRTICPSERLSGVQ